MGLPGVTGFVASRRVVLCLKRTRRYDDITNVDKLTGVQTQVNQVKEVMLEDLETKAGACAYSHRRTRARADTHGRMNARAQNARGCETEAGAPTAAGSTALYQGPFGL